MNRIVVNWIKYIRNGLLFMILNWMIFDTNYEYYIKSSSIFDGNFDLDTPLVEMK